MKERPLDTQCGPPVPVRPWVTWLSAEVISLFGGWGPGLGCMSPPSSSNCKANEYVVMEGKALGVGVGVGMSSGVCMWVWVCGML